MQIFFTEVLTFTSCLIPRRYVHKLICLLADPRNIHNMILYFPSFPSSLCYTKSNSFFSHFLKGPIYKTSKSHLQDLLVTLETSQDNRPELAHYFPDRADPPFSGSECYGRTALVFHSITFISINISSLTRNLGSQGEFHLTKCR